MGCPRNDGDGERYRGKDESKYPRVHTSSFPLVVDIDTRGHPGVRDEPKDFCKDPMGEVEAVVDEGKIGQAEGYYCQASHLGQVGRRHYQGEYTEYREEGHPRYIEVRL